MGSEELELEQRRLRTFGQTLFIFSAALHFQGAAYLLLTQSPSIALQAGFVSIPAASSAVVIGLSGFGCWWLRKDARPPAAVRALDCLLTVSVGVAAAALAAMLDPGDAVIHQTASSGVAVALLLSVRAALIPSSWKRTLVVGLASYLPLFAVAWWRYGWALPRNALVPVGDYSTFVMVWGLAFVAASTMLSYLIFKLRRQVRAAQRVGQYTLVAKLGEGGMGVVYRATHRLLRRPTAIKVLAPNMTEPADVARFEREVQQTARLAHPNTVAVYDYGRTAEGIFYYVMEYLPGLNLKELVDQHGPQPAGRVINLVSQAASGLSEAHRLGLVHRDVKPGNIIVCDRGGVADMVKVVDFGLVRVASNDPSSTLTEVGTVAGTPQYLAPETIRDPLASGPAADLYALGCVAYFLLTGGAVFSGSGPEIIASHLLQPPVPPSKRTEQPIPTDLERVVMRCLEKDPARRPADALVLREMLLGCESANAWQRIDAERWWSNHRKDVDTYRARVSTKVRDVLQVTMDGRTPVSTKDPASTSTVLAVPWSSRC